MRCLFALGFATLGATASAADLDRFEPGGSVSHGSGLAEAESALLDSTRAGVSGALGGTVARDLVARADMPNPMLVEAYRLEAQVGYAWKDRIRVDVLLPLYPRVVEGTKESMFTLGDVRVRGVVPLWKDRTEAPRFGLALVPTLGLPTSDPDVLVSRGVHGGASLAFSSTNDAPYGGAIQAGAVGAARDEAEYWVPPELHVSDPPDAVVTGSTIDVAGGMWIRAADQVRLGLEADTSVDLGDWRSSVASAHVIAAFDVAAGVSVTLAGGRGVAGYAGSPSVRIYGAVGWAPRITDLDGDGLSDARDRCPREPEDIDGTEDEDGCIDADDDGDGLDDIHDACPKAAEDMDGFRDGDGCPEPDNDSDGVKDFADECPLTAGKPGYGGCPESDGDHIIDKQDRCVDEPGPNTTWGCPDMDGDGVADRVDRCPETPRAPHEDLRFSDGCPRDVFVTNEGHLDGFDPILFGVDSSSISQRWAERLDAVASALAEYPGLRLLEVAGHADSAGDKTYNRILSRRRADAVVGLLTQRGISAKRLVVAGYGEDRPAMSNATPEGRAGNRRVDFNILEQDAQRSTEPPTQTLTRRVIIRQTPKAGPKVEKQILGDLSELSVELRGVGFAQVFLNGRKLAHTAPFENLPLEPGVYELRVVNEAVGLNFVERVELQTGLGATVLADLAEQRLAEE